MKKNFKNLDFVPTISDSEDDIPDLDDNSDVESSAPVEVKKNVSSKKQKKQKKGKKGNSNQLNAHGEDEVHEDLNEDFNFNLDDDDEFSKASFWISRMGLRWK